MKDIAFLEYAFMFEPDSTFSTLNDFEVTLAEVFRSQGYTAEVISSVKGYIGRRVIFVSKKKKDILDDPSLPFKKKEKK